LGGNEGDKKMKHRSSAFLKPEVVKRIDKVYHKLHEQGFSVTKSEMQETWIEDGLETIEEDLKKEE
jgi:nucleoside diphosphate kinase